jgi:GrpB-like predicted nucleotidyltransferase (UPF0157 family)
VKLLYGLVFMPMELFILDPDPLAADKAEQAYQLHATHLRKLLPYAQIEHIGSTSIPNAIGKGDLDILVSVPGELLEAADVVLAKHFMRNTESIRDANFSSFKDDSLVPPLGIQVVVQGSEYDDFLVFRDALRSDPCLLRSFNDLKREWHGKAMDDYRLAKSAFIAEVLLSRTTESGS